MASLRARLAESANIRGIPRYFSVQLQLLHACNLRCAHCYDIDGRPPPAMPDTAAIKARLDAIAQLGRHVQRAPDVHLSGGEPTLRKDLVALVDHAVQRCGLGTLLFTNGTRWTRARGWELWSAGLRHVQVSLEGPEPLTDAVRGQGVYADARKTLDLLLDQGYRPTVSITVTARNFPSLFDFVAELAPLGLHFHIREVFPLGAGKTLEGLTKDQRRALSQWAVAWQGKSTVGVEDPVHCSVAPEFARTQSGCVAGRNHCCIDVDGSVLPCRPLAWPVGHADDLIGAWQSPVMRRLRHRELEGDCGRCALRWHCGGCRVHARAQGDVWGGDDRCFANETRQLVYSDGQAKLLQKGERLGRRISGMLGV